MAITFQEKAKTQRYLVFVFVIVILAIVLVNFVFLRGKKISPTQPLVYQPPEIRINFEVFNAPFVKELLPFEEIKPFEGKVGREDPFSPYQPISPVTIPATTTPTL